MKTLVPLPATAELTTTQLAQRTGIPAGTLRMWESRHGFPQPTRLPSGHRRYSERDADAVREVLRLRAQGLSLTAAIEGAHRSDRRQPASIYAELRESRPELQTTVLSKRALLRMTRAIEDEYCARAGSGVLICSFQHVRFYLQSRRRWCELARTAELAVALADFKTVRQPRRGPIEVPVDREHPLAREWTLLIDAPQMHACLAAWERPAPSELPDQHRRFEVLWSPEPEAVRATTTIAAELIRGFAPAVARRLPVAWRAPIARSSPELRRATALAHRISGYLGAQLDPPAGVRG